ncbi:MAG TPA: hypothetical protein VMZ53_10530 [Kofleriaceae bacterium]|nr:hypothetical protein [Kofleriaceae bacterium]
MHALIVVAALATDWFDGLTAKVIEDVKAGKPLVVEVHVPLCDNEFTRCGNAKLGDGDNPETNLYWSTTPGLGVWFARKAGGWQRVFHATDGKDTGDKDVLELHVYRRTITTSAAWRKLGAPKSYEVDLVVHGWRGSAIDRALAAYASDVSGEGTRTITLANKTEIAAGGAARIVAFVGHNRLMDLDKFEWPKPGADIKGTIAIACHTKSYMKEDVPAASRVPLLMTNDFLFSNAAPLEAAVLAFARGGGYAAIRKDAATAYAGVQKRDVKRVIGAFTNPADKKW